MGQVRAPPDQAALAAVRGTVDSISQKGKSNETDISKMCFFCSGCTDYRIFCLICLCRRNTVSGGSTDADRDRGS